MLLVFGKYKFICAIQVKKLSPVRSNVVFLVLGYQKKKINFPNHGNNLWGQGYQKVSGIGAAASHHGCTFRIKVFINVLFFLLVYISADFFTETRKVYCFNIMEIVW